MRVSIVVATALCAGLAACSSSGTKGMTVSASAVPAVTAAPGTPAAPAASIDGGNGISIDRVRLVVKKFEVEGTPACPATAAAASTTGMGGPGKGLTAADHGSDGSGSAGGTSGADDGSAGDGSDDGECEIESGPFLVDLQGTALTVGVHAVAGIDLPAGTYEELRFQIAPTSDVTGDLAAMAGASIVVDGTDGTTPFTFKSSLSVSQKREGAIVVDPTTGTNVTLDFDPSGWFRAADGTKLDPSSADAAAAIEANIRASVRVVHDDDHDGEDDDHGGEGAGHG